MGFGRMRFLDETLVRPKVTKTMILRIISYFTPYWKQILIVILAVSATSVLGLVPPLLIRNIVDLALPQKNLSLLSKLAFASFGVTVVSGLISVGESYLNSWISNHIIYDIKNQLYHHLEYMSLNFFSTVKSGEIITRMNSDVGGIRSVFSGTVVSIFQNVLVFVSTALALLSMNWKLALVGMFVIPSFVFPTRKVGKVRWQIAAQTQKKASELNELIQETLSISGSTLVKIFTKEKVAFKNFIKVNKEVTALHIKESLAGRWFHMIIRIFTSIGPLTIYFFGGYLFIKDEITIGAIIAFVTMLNRLYGPVSRLSNIHIDVTRSLALFERIFDYFDKKHEITDAPEAFPLPPINGRVQFKEVTFAYTQRQSTLKKISFSVEPGQMVALVGPSGAGKTTITNLLPRLYDVTAGRILIDGIDIRAVTLESLRAQIGIVMQDPYIFNGTIRQNLLFAKPDATETEVLAACQSAYIHEFIMTLPEGYDTLVGNRGVKLSGGEKQRLSLAQMILKDPRIIILDEATSALDSVSEALIQKALEPLLKGRTSFVIAHRLSTIISADLILVINHGEVVETGKHEELLQANTLYKVLYDKQFKTGPNFHFDLQNEEIG